MNNFWDNIAGFYDLFEAVNGKVYGEMLSITARLVPKGARVLDCAAETGALSFAAAKKARSVLCTDLSEKMLKIAKIKAKALGITNISYDTRNIFDLKDDDETYDIVIAGNVLHLLENPAGAVKELYRVLKRGGKLLLPVFTIKNKGGKLLGLYKLIGFKPAAEYSPAEFKAMLRNCGCGRVKTKLVEGFVPCCYAVIIKD